MRKSKPLSKAALDVITNINSMLRAAKVTDQSNLLFTFGCRYLLDKNMYHGFNMFIEKPSCLGGYFITEAGDEWDNGYYLQIYVSHNLSIGIDRVVLSNK